MVQSILVFQDKSESGLASVEVFNGLVDILHGENSNPRTDVLLGSESEHFFDFLGRTNERTTDVDLTESQDKRTKRRELPVRQVYVKEVTVGTDKSKVLFPYNKDNRLDPVNVFFLYLFQSTMKTYM